MNSYEQGAVCTLHITFYTCIYACLISLWRSECEVHYIVMLFTVGLHCNYYRVFLSLKWLLVYGVEWLASEERG